MRISHKWSHTETILQAQSQSHNLTSSHKISGSYPPGSACPSYIFILFLCDHHWNYPPGSVPDFILVKAIRPAQPHYHTFFLTIWDYSSHRDPRSIIIQISIHISQFHHIFHISQFHISTQIHMSMFLSHFLAHT